MRVEVEPTTSRRKTAEIAIAAVGAALVIVPLATTQDWLDTHFLPSFMVSRSWYVAKRSGAAPESSEFKPRMLQLRIDHQSPKIRGCGFNLPSLKL